MTEKEEAKIEAALFKLDGVIVAWECPYGISREPISHGPQQHKERFAYMSNFKPFYVVYPCLAHVSHYRKSSSKNNVQSGWMELPPNANGNDGRTED